MTDDIVARLREEGFVTHMARLPRESKILHDAADEIERLRAERDGYLEGNRQTLGALAEANEIAKRYREERDEARRRVCDGCAEIMGLNCFKEAR